MILPGFGGSELAAKVIRKRPETKVLYVSGYNDESIAPMLVPGHRHGFLKKPFTQDDLLKKILSRIPIPSVPLHERTSTRPRVNA